MQDSSWKRSIRWVAPIIWMGVIFVLSSQSTLPAIIRSKIDMQSILGHLLAYAVLAWLTRDALQSAGIPHPGVVAVVFCAIYGLSDEFHQSFVPNRTPDLFDVATDILGACLGAAASPRLHWPWSRATQHPGQDTLR